VLAAKNWKLESVLRLGVGVFLCIALGSVLTLLLAGNDAEATPTVGRILVGTLCFQLGLLVLLARFLREQQLTWAAAFGLDRDPGRAVRLGLVAVAAFLPLAWGLQLASQHLLKWAGIEPTEQAALLALRNSASGWEIVALGGVTVILAPVAEELLFRGVLYPALKDTGFRRGAVGITSVLFALVHFNLAAFLPLLLLAGLFLWLYEKTDNLVAPIAAHVLFNALNFGLFFLARDFAGTLPPQS
jgi:membrane protease YdiL (CAAX protease family)